MLIESIMTMAVATEGSPNRYRSTFSTSCGHPSLAGARGRTRDHGREGGRVLAIRIDCVGLVQVWQVLRGRQRRNMFLARGQASFAVDKLTLAIDSILIPALLQPATDDMDAVGKPNQIRFVICIRV